MIELKVFELKVGKNLETDSPLVVGVDNKLNSRIMSGEEVYLKSEADKVISEKDAEIARLNNRIAPKQSDKILQERLNEVCEKHGVSTLQDLDWAFCKTEARLTDYAKLMADFVIKIAHHKYKRCLAIARLCRSRSLNWYDDPTDEQLHKSDFYDKWQKHWLELAEKFKEVK